MKTTLFLVASILVAQAQPIAWNRSAESMAGQFAQVKLTNVTRIGGTWVSVTPKSFTMNVEKTSNKTEIGKGLQSIPRSSLLQLRAGTRRARGRVIGTLTGYFVIAAIAGLASGAEAAQGPWGLAILGGGIAGYYIGKSVDYDAREISFLPDTPAAIATTPSSPNP